MTSNAQPPHHLPASTASSQPSTGWSPANQQPFGYPSANQQPFGYPPVAGPTPPQVQKSAGSLVCGLLGMIFALLPLAWFFGWILCIIGIALGTRKRSTAGLVMGIIGLAITIAQFVYVGSALSSLG